MGLIGAGRSTLAIFLFVVILLPFGIIAPGVRPTWTKEEWAMELENVRQKHFPGVDAGIDGRLPQFIECGLNPPVKMFTGLKTCNDDVRKVLLNEVLLRKQISSFNEDCNSHGTKEGQLILNPPEQLGRSEINHRTYAEEWQDQLIDSKLQFCDPLKYLRCSQQKKCVCDLNSNWSPASDVGPRIKVKNTCAYFEDKDCTGEFNSFGIRKYYFQLFGLFLTEVSTSADSVEITSPRCRDEDTSCSRAHVYLKEQAYCVTDETFNSRRLDFLKIDTNFDTPLYDNPLGFGEKCNFGEHNRFFTYSKEEDGSYDVRLQNIANIRKRGTKLCAIRQLLTCGPSDICECMSPTSRVADKCVLPPEFDECSLNLKLEPILMNKSILSSARQKLMTGFASAVTAKACEGKLTCQTDMMEMYCTCPPGTTGLACTEKLTKFLYHVRVPSLPTEVSGYAEKVKIFSVFNEKALQFEQNFKLREGAVCDWKIQNEAEILVGRIRELMFPLTTMTTKKYEDLGKEIQNFSPPPQGICKLPLRCQYSTQECVRQSRQNYLQDLAKELKKSKTLKCKESGCSKFAKLDVFKFRGNETDFFGGEDEMEYFQIIQENSVLLKSSAKFCLVDGSCSGSIPGTCDCEVGDEKKGMNTKKVTQSFAHFCHLPNIFILLTSVATFFVVSNY